jgi:hypothetical protein
MPFFTSGGGGGGSIAEDMYFFNIAARDDFTTNNQDRIIEGVVCAVSNGPDAYDYYMYSGLININGTWRDANLIYQGRQGDKGDKGDHIASAVFSGGDIVFTDTGARQFALAGAVATLTGPEGPQAPNIINEYSIDAGGPWVDQATYNGNPNLYAFKRESVDGGTSFAAGYQFKSSQSELPAGWRWIDDGLGGLQLQDVDGHILWQVSEEGVTSARFSIQDSVLKFGSTKAMHDLGENVGFVNEVTSKVFTPIWQEGDGDWKAFCRKKVRELIRYNGETFVNADLGNTTTFELPITVTFSRRSTAFYVNSVSSFTNCTLLILQAGKTKMKLDGYNILAGEQRYLFADSFDGHPFIDFLQGQSYTIKLINESGSEITVYAQEGNPALPWFALDTTEFEDAPLLGSDSAGDGLTFDVDTNTLNVTVGTADDIGGFKVGSGLAVDVNNRLYSTVSGSIVVVVADLTARNALPQIAQSYTANVQSENRIYYLNSNLNPSVDANWTLGPTTEASVTGFKGKGDTAARVGVIEATQGDYTSDEITYKDATTNKKYKLVIDDGAVYAEEI